MLPLIYLAFAPHVPGHDDRQEWRVRSGTGATCFRDVPMMRLDRHVVPLREAHECGSGPSVRLIQRLLRSGELDAPHLCPNH